MSACAVMLLQVESGAEKGLKEVLAKVTGVHFVDQIRGPYQLLVGFTKMSHSTPVEFDALPGVNRTQSLEALNGCMFLPTAS